MGLNTEAEMLHSVMMLPLTEEITNGLVLGISTNTNLLRAS